MSAAPGERFEVEDRDIEFHFDRSEVKIEQQLVHAEVITETTRAVAARPEFRKRFDLVFRMNGFEVWRRR